MADSKTQPIIIKKIKKGGGGHHGGAWKVAYADFVTAMMAFFLLLWLLSSTSEEQKQGIAEFFTPTIGLKDAKGIGVKGGKAKTVDGSSQNDKTPSGLVVGRTASGPIIQVPEDQQKKSKEDDGSPESKGKVSEGEEIHAKEKQAEGEVGGNADQELFDQAAQEVQKAFADDEELRKFKDNVVVTNTPEGLKIDIVDDLGQPMFAPGSATMTTVGKKILQKMGDIIGKTPNQVSLAGHTDASAFSGPNGYGNWELSSDRANASRRYMQSSVVLGNDRITKVTGMADRDLMIPGEPNNPRNRRLSITLLRGQYVSERREVNPAAKSLVTLPSVDSGSLKSPPAVTPETAPKESEPPAPAMPAQPPSVQQIAPVRPAPVQGNAGGMLTPTIRQ